MERQPLNPHAFDELKLAEDGKQKTVDRLFSYQTDTRQRADTLIKAIFVLSGGALTISIGIFLRSGAPLLNTAHILILQVSWTLLFYSLAASALVLFAMICQGYYYCQLWERSFNTGKNETQNNFWLKLSRFINWALGISGFLAFLVGLGLLAFVSAAAIKP